MSAAGGSFALLSDAAAGLSGVTSRPMFGCPCLWADGKIFALVWKEGRIALKLPSSAGELLRERGARPWTIGAKKMGAWALVPESFHDDADALALWASRAHAEVLACAAQEHPAPAALAARRQSVGTKGAPKRATTKLSAPAKTARTKRALR